MSSYSPSSHEKYDPCSLAHIPPPTPPLLLSIERPPPPRPNPPFPTNKASMAVADNIAIHARPPSDGGTTTTAATVLS